MIILWRSVRWRFLCCNPCNMVAIYMLSWRMMRNSIKCRGVHWVTGILWKDWLEHASSPQPIWCTESRVWSVTRFALCTISTKEIHKSEKIEFVFKVESSFHIGPCVGTMYAKSSCHFLSRLRNPYNYGRLPGGVGHFGSAGSVGSAKIQCGCNQPHWNQDGGSWHSYGDLH